MNAVFTSLEEPIVYVLIGNAIECSACGVYERRVSYTACTAGVPLQTETLVEHTPGCSHVATAVSGHGPKVVQKRGVVLVGGEEGEPRVSEFDHFVDVLCHRKEIDGVFDVLPGVSESNNVGLEGVAVVEREECLQRVLVAREAVESHLGTSEHVVALLNKHRGALFACNVIVFAEFDHTRDIHLTFCDLA